MSAPPCLVVAGFGVSFGKKTVLEDVDFSVAPRSVTVLLGPAGSGKSTMLRALAGLNASNARCLQTGQAWYLGQPLSAEHRPHFVQQTTRLMATTTLEALAEPVRAQLSLPPAELRQWVAEYVTRMGFPELQAAFDVKTVELPAVQLRAVAILREAVCQPALLMVDEPTADLSDYDAYLLLDLLRAVARHSSLLLVLHNHKHAHMLGDSVVLLADGRVQEVGAMDRFLSTPQSLAGQQFVRTGHCAVPESAPDASTAPEPVAAPSQASGPSGFSWLLPGKLAGTPQPGAVDDIDADLAALKRAGVTLLITLTEEDLAPEPLRRHGLSNLHLPIYSLEPPTVAQNHMLLRRMEVLLAQGHVLAVHCLNGIGRTGTVLAAWLVHQGLTAPEALRRIRLIDAKYVQSPEQEAFLQRFEDAILHRIS
ncbi:MAG: ATP-binding cassette domain-containing protein [Giesbergeria sp.]|nr:ATP-binding cassette domain-containing protein [Giesbergeria sp.]